MLRAIREWRNGSEDPEGWLDPDGPGRRSGQQASSVMWSHTMTSNKNVVFVHILSFLRINLLLGCTVISLTEPLSSVTRSQCDRVPSTVLSLIEVATPLIV